MAHQQTLWLAIARFLSDGFLGPLRQYRYNTTTEQHKALFHIHG